MFKCYSTFIYVLAIMWSREKRGHWETFVTIDQTQIYAILATLLVHAVPEEGWECCLRMQQIVMARRPKTSLWFCVWKSKMPKLACLCHLYVATYSAWLEHQQTHASCHLSTTFLNKNVCWLAGMLAFYNGKSAFWLRLPDHFQHVKLVTWRRM